MKKTDFQQDLNNAIDIPDNGKSTMNEALKLKLKNEENTTRIDTHSDLKGSINSI